jgi:hypothetical protein
MLIITNGDSAVEAIKNARIEAEILPWRDVLHDGPVPLGLNLLEMATVRARFVADCGWGKYDQILKMFEHQYSKLQSFSKFEELVLWFEHDLYDQLQLIQILDFLATADKKSTKISLICKDRFVSDSSAKELKIDFENREEITKSKLELGKKGWAAFKSKNPTNIEKFLLEDNSALPFLKDSFLRFLEEYPEQKSGISRNERQILELIANGYKLPARIFRASQKYEDPIYLGDWSFWRYMGQMVNCENPLLITENEEPFLFPPKQENKDKFLLQKLFLTDLGSKVLNCEKNWVLINGIDKWFGGVHLTPENLWWWDQKSKSLVKSS